MDFICKHMFKIDKHTTQLQCWVFIKDSNPLLFHSDSLIDLLYNSPKKQRLTFYLQQTHQNIKGKKKCLQQCHYFLKYLALFGPEKDFLLHSLNFKMLSNLGQNHSSKNRLFILRELHQHKILSITFDSPSFTNSDPCMQKQE